METHNASVQCNLKKNLVNSSHHFFSSKIENSKFKLRSNLGIKPFVKKGLVLKRLHEFKMTRCSSHSLIKHMNISDSRNFLPRKLLFASRKQESYRGNSKKDVADRSGSALKSYRIKLMMNVNL